MALRHTLAFGSLFLNANNRFLAYANEAVLPFYILHQTVIIVIGVYVVQWAAGVEVKYLTISKTLLVAIMAIYELVVRRINLLRFLFGMKTRRGLSIPDRFQQLVSPETAVLEEKR